MLQSIKPEQYLVVIAALRDVARPLDLVGAQHLIRSMPSLVKDGLSKAEATKICEKLKECGASATVEKDMPPSTTPTGPTGPAR
jgi:ribosomal protein L7/L12